MNNKRQKFYYREIPTDDSPAYVGKIIKGHVDGNNLIATILDLTYKGYIKIEVEKIEGQNKRVLYLQKNDNSLDLREQELFVISQIFKTNDRVIFEYYINSLKFKQDFKVFDNMMDRRSEIKKKYKTSIMKNVNKIILFTNFLLFGIVLFYSITLSITICIVSKFTDNIKTTIVTNIIISIIMYFLVSYKYILYINKTTNAQENINLNITYIILSIIICLILGFGSYEKILSLLYYQFESIHPFLDGNGRTGRILIPNYLLSKGLISKPCFYISDYIEKNKDAYYDFLSRARTQNDILSWIKFFLEATIETAKTARIKFEKIVKFTNEMNNVVLNMPVRPENARMVIDCMYNEPTINRKILMEKTGLKPTALKSVVNSLLEKELIVENTGYSRNQIFTFEKYINLFK